MHCLLCSVWKCFKFYFYCVINRFILITNWVIAQCLISCITFSVVPDTNWYLPLPPFVPSINPFITI